MHAVITTINHPTDCVYAFSNTLSRYNVKLIVCGDAGGPPNNERSDDRSWQKFDAEFLSLDDQQRLPYALVKTLPEGHYSRKNIGYLRAMEAGAECIYETDDDNRPNDTWKPREEFVKTAYLQSSETLRWVNAYRLFTRMHIWPRGLPLDQLGQPLPKVDLCESIHHAPIQQGLANVAPDVDAVWRLTQGKKFFFPIDGGSFLLKRGNWCPFNTQSTWWWPKAYPLLYVPSHCPFRMCDIWRSFVAQRCVWEFADGVAFHSPEVDQLRNRHNLMEDFEGELQGYLRNHEIARSLHGGKLLEGIDNLFDNLMMCYEALVNIGVFPSEELALLRLWIDDCGQLTPSFS